MKRCENCEQYKDGRCSTYLNILEDLNYVESLSEPSAKDFACCFGEYCKYYKPTDTEPVSLNMEF